MNKRNERAKQKYKTVYFSDFPADTSKQKTLTLAFGKKTADLHTGIKDLSGAEIRQLLGTDRYESILNDARSEDLPVNTYCLRRLDRALNTLREQESQLSLPGFDGPKFFDPISVTFKGGSKEPFARWYPYLEGYSPQFVERILERYAADARHVLDPFAGTGTTVLTASRLNKKSCFCEVNPVLQFVTLTKMRVRQLESACRMKLVQDLEKLNTRFGEFETFPPDPMLQRTYKRTFGTSLFFDKPVYEQVLKLRTWIDQVALTHPMPADLFTISVMSALVPASRMKRSGDLRYKTAKELEKYQPPLVEQVQQRIAQMIFDIQGDANGVKNNPLFICGNAASLAYIPRLEIDTLITSPPYINGTNYFRNTKMELWFLRGLKGKDDLSKFRGDALTAGINDVTVAKVRSCEVPEVQQVVSLLKEKAYDSRIPHMVESYFGEITDIFETISGHLKVGATVAIDIGDSAYAGVHVPAHQLLRVCLESLGFVPKDEILLRERKSRGGMMLRQSLLVFEYRPGHPPFYVKELFLPWRIRWDEFKTDLPHQKAPFTKRNWGHPLHSLCSYPGKLKPAIAHYLVKTFVPEKGRLLDPFAGAGTIPFEAALQGRHACGFELSPAACVIAGAKLGKPEGEKVVRLIDRLESFVKANSPTDQELAETRELGFNGKVAEYYEPRTLNEILLARRHFRLHPPVADEACFVMASLLHILHGNRPYALSRRSHPITPYKPTGPFEYRPLIDRLRAKVTRSLQRMPQNFQRGKMFLQDATGCWPREIEALDAVITSPPFFDSTRFHLANWLRLWFAGWSLGDFRTRPAGFVDERQKKSFDVYVPIMRQARERLKPDGVLLLHLGRSRKCDMADQLKRLARHWFRSADIFDESVAHCESHGIRDKGTVTFHQYLVLY